MHLRQRRDLIAAAALQGLLSNPFVVESCYIKFGAQGAARELIEQASCCAGALIDELDK